MTKERMHHHSVINVKLRCPETRKLLHIFNCLEIAYSPGGGCLKAFYVDKYDSFEKGVDLKRDRIDVYIPDRYIVRMETWSSNSYTPHRDIKRGSYDDTRSTF
tara:strand:- start:447 stop:755 length:309 start_codon:yes stop_codon:yes gene_type:complete